MGQEQCIGDLFPEAAAGDLLVAAVEQNEERVRLLDCGVVFAQDVADGVDVGLHAFATVLTVGTEKNVFLQAG